MPYLVVLRDARLVQVVELAGPQLELGVHEDRLEPAGKDGLDPATTRKLVVTAFGGSCELRALGDLKLVLDGRESARRLLRTGDVVELAGLTVHFTSDAPARAPAAPPSRRWMDALLMLADRCHSSQDQAQLLENVMDALMDICHAQRGFLVLTGPDGALELAVSRKLRKSDTEQFSKTVVQQALAARHPVLVADASQDPALATAHSVVTERLRSIVAAPLYRGERALGAVYLDRSASESLFSPEDVALLTAAAAVSNATSSGENRLSLALRSR